MHAYMQLCLYKCTYEAEYAVLPRICNLRRLEFLHWLRGPGDIARAVGPEAPGSTKPCLSRSIPWLFAVILQTVVSAKIGSTHSQKTEETLLALSRYQSNPKRMHRQYQDFVTYQDRRLGS